jgi:hypothetical protein
MCCGGDLVPVVRRCLWCAAIVSSLLSLCLDENDRFWAPLLPWITSSCVDTVPGVLLLIDFHLIAHVLRCFGEMLGVAVLASKALCFVELSFIYCTTYGALMGARCKGSWVHLMTWVVFLKRLCRLMNPLIIIQQSVWPVAFLKVHIEFLMLVFKE